MRLHLQLASLYILLHSRAISGQQPRCPSTLSLSMKVEGHAPIVTLNFTRPDGTIRSARFVFDSGGGAIIVDQGLADDLHLQPSGKAVVEDGARFAPTDSPVAQVGHWPLSLATSKAFIHVGPGSFDTREHVEGLLPGKALEPYQVVLDYPRQRFTIAPTGCVKHRGEPVSSPFLPASGHPRIVVSLQGQPYGLLLDTGSRVTLARRDLLKSLSAAHPEWPHATGASGVADMPGSDGTEFLLRVPEVLWGAFHLNNVLFVSRTNETYSASNFETPGPISGAIGGNVLRAFRVEIDYPHGTTYLEQKTADLGGDMNSAGLVLDVDAANHLVVRALSNTAAALTRRNIRPGDQIVEIDGKREISWTIIEASNALSGTVGDTRRLTILRDGQQIQTMALVVRIL